MSAYTHEDYTQSNMRLSSPCKAPRSEAGSINLRLTADFMQSLNEHICNILYN